MLIHVGVNSPLYYTGCVDSNIFLLFSYSIWFVLVRLCEILGRNDHWNKLELSIGLH